MTVSTTPFMAGLEAVLVSTPHFFNATCVFATTCATSRELIEVIFIGVPKETPGTTAGVAEPGACTGARTGVPKETPGTTAGVAEPGTCTGAGTGEPGTCTGGGVKRTGATGPITMATKIAAAAARATKCFHHRLPNFTPEFSMYLVYNEIPRPAFNGSGSGERSLIPLVQSSFFFDAKQLQ
jgi:hypothetical protein